MTPLAAALLAALQVGHPGELPVAGRAATELSALRPGVTPSAWLATHPGDVLLLFRRSGSMPTPSRSSVLGQRLGVRSLPHDEPQHYSRQIKVLGSQPMT